MRSRPLVLSALSASVAAFTAFGIAGAQAGASGQTPHSRPLRGASSTPSPLIDHGGKILTGSKTYAIWWGPTSQFPSDARSGMEQLLGGFGGSSYLAVAN